VRVDAPRARKVRPMGPGPSPLSVEILLSNETVVSRVIDPALRKRMDDLIEDGYEIWARFDVEVRLHTWHPFVPLDYEQALKMLLDLPQGPLKFLEWGSGTGVIAI